MRETTHDYGTHDDLQVGKLTFEVEYTTRTDHCPGDRDTPPCDWTEITEVNILSAWDEDGEDQKITPGFIMQHEADVQAHLESELGI